MHTTWPVDVMSHVAGCSASPRMQRNVKTPLSPAIASEMLQCDRQPPPMVHRTPTVPGPTPAYSHLSVLTPLSIHPGVETLNENHSPGEETPGWGAICDWCARAQMILLAGEVL